MTRSFAICWKGCSGHISERRQRGWEGAEKSEIFLLPNDAANNRSVFCSFWMHVWSFWFTSELFKISQKLLQGWMTGDFVKRKRAAPSKSAKAPVFLLTASSKKRHDLQRNSETFWCWVFYKSPNRKKLNKGWCHYRHWQWKQEYNVPFHPLHAVFYFKAPHSITSAHQVFLFFLLKQLHIIL